MITYDFQIHSIAFELEMQFPFADGTSIQFPVWKIVLNAGITVS
jgi:hypothetical protein